MMFKVIALAVIVTLVNGQTVYRGTPAQFTQFRAIKTQILSCQKKFVCRSFMGGAADNSIECIDFKRWCDGHNDCSNMLDEMNCPTICPAGRVICPDKRTCAVTCDGTNQCPGHEDEKGCAKRCGAGELLCSDKQTCAKVCDHVKQCQNGIDEKSCPIKCAYGEILCNNKCQCAQKCDGIQQCPDGEDEVTCPYQCRAPQGSYLCAAGNMFIPRRQVCNEMNDCPGNDDETPCT